MKAPTNEAVIAIMRTMLDSMKYAQGSARNLVESGVRGMAAIDKDLGAVISRHEKALAVLTQQRLGFGYRVALEQAILRNPLRDWTTADVRALTGASYAQAFQLLQGRERFEETKERRDGCVIYRQRIIAT